MNYGHDAACHAHPMGRTVRASRSPLRLLLPARGVVLAGAMALMGLPAALPPAPLAAQERVYHPFHLPAAHNWALRSQFPGVDRLFNAFDYGHGILYETLLIRPEGPSSLLEGEIYDRLTLEILPRPPRLPLPEASFMPHYARLVPEAKAMFEWAHILHRQSYDILADPGLSSEERDLEMQALLDYYLASDLAFAVEPKAMAIMDEQPFSMTFRAEYPRFNGLIWAYHWLQVAIYEPLLVLDDPAERQAAVQATVARFWQMLEDPPNTLPSEMPMTPAIAPEFTRRYPVFAAIFDNLHMMHDVISDVLVSDLIEASDKGAEIYRQADLFRDPTAMAISEEEWIAMARAHGIDAQGGYALESWQGLPGRTASPGGDGGGHDAHLDSHDTHDGHDSQDAPDAGDADPHVH